MVRLGKGFKKVFLWWAFFVPALAPNQENKAKTSHSRRDFEARPNPISISRQQPSFNFRLSLNHKLVPVVFPSALQASPPSKTGSQRVSNLSNVLPA
jgi:hypothetical protein